MNRYRSLSMRCTDTGIGEVLGFRPPTMFATNDLAHLVWRVRIVLMKGAIFTAMASAFCDESPQRLACVTLKLGVLPRPRLHDDHNVLELHALWRES